MGENECILNSSMRLFELLHNFTQELFMDSWSIWIFFKKDFQVSKKILCMNLYFLAYHGSVVGGASHISCQLRIFSKASFASWCRPWISIIMSYNLSWSSWSSYILLSRFRNSFYLDSSFSFISNVWALKISIVNVDALFSSRYFFEPLSFKL